MIENDNGTVDGVVGAVALLGLQVDDHELIFPAGRQRLFAH